MMRKLSRQLSAVVCLFTLLTLSAIQNPAYAGHQPAGAALDTAHYLGSCSFYEYTKNNNITSNSSTDYGPLIQNWLLDCQLKAYALMLNTTTRADNLDDQTERNCIRADLGRGDYQVTVPPIIPELVCANFKGSIVRVGQVGVATNFYNGDTSTQALANLEQPTVIVVPHAHTLGTMTIYANSNGSDKGSGIVYGKYWNPTSTGFTIRVPGTGYAPGDAVWLANPSKAPYGVTQINVSTVDGNGGILTGTMFSPGEYALPPKLQQLQWTAANGFTGSMAFNFVGKVFDPAHPGWFITLSNHSGTGAEISLDTWTPDFAGGGAIYNCGNVNGLIGDTIIENVNVTGMGITNDATYGPEFGVMICDLNYDITGMVQTNFGYYGDYILGAADVHGGTFNPVNAAHAMKIVKGGSMDFKLLVDTPSIDCLEADVTSQLNIRGYGISFGSASGISGTACINLGGDSSLSGSGNVLTAANIDMTLQNMGSAGTTPAAFLDYISGASNINLRVSNLNASGTGQTYQNKLFAQFGTHNANAFTLGGSIDNVTGAIFSGTVPNSGINVWDVNLPGYAIGSGACSMQTAGAPTSGGSGTGLNVCGKGSHDTDTTNGVLYINIGTASSPNWVSFLSGNGTAATTSNLSSCGTSPGISGNDAKGTITEGSTATGCTFTFATAKAADPGCIVTSEAGLGFTYTHSTAGFVVTNGGALSGTKLDYVCLGN